MKMATCHPDRQVRANGLCDYCYKKSNKDKWNKEGIGKKANCHPDKKHYSNGLCKSCYRKQYMANNPDKVIAYKSSYTEKMHGYMIKYRFGITSEQYQEMQKKQNGICAICGKPEKGIRKMSVDHNHTNGKVRGLLCQRCNTIIGMATDDIQVLKSAIGYLQSYKE